MSKFAVSVGSAVGKYGTKFVLGAGYIALRGAYALGEAGEAAIAAGTVEAQQLSDNHDKLMVIQQAEAAQRRIELKARMLLLSNARAAGLAVELTTAAVMQPVVVPAGKRKTAAA